MLRKKAETTADKADELFKLAKQRYAIGSYTLAIEAYTSSIRMKPSYLTYVNRGICYAKYGENEKALSDFNTALKVAAGLEFSDKSDQLAAIYYNRAVFYWNNGKKNEALADISKAIALNPVNRWYYRERSKEYLANSHDPEQLGRAIADLDHEIELVPEGDYFFSYLQRGGIISVEKALNGIKALPGNMQIPLLEKLLDPKSWLRKDFSRFSDENTLQVKQALQAAKQLVPAATKPAVIASGTYDRNVSFFKVEPEVYLQTPNPGFEAEANVNSFGL